MSGLLENKNILIMGVANKWSIGWGIAQSCISAGANVILTYQNARTEDSVKELVQDLTNVKLYPCDVSIDEDVSQLFRSIKDDFGILHGLVHSLAFAKKEELSGKYYSTSRDGYLLAQNISAFSLVQLSREAIPVMNSGGSIVTITFLGGERVIPNYNVMGVAKASLEASVKYLAADLGELGIRVNAVSAGPIKTLAAKGIKDFNEMLRGFEQKAPLRRMVSQSEVGDTALFLLSEMSRGVTGENIHVDSGYHILGY